MMWDRSTFTSPMYGKVFHLVPAGSSALSDLSRKYGAENVRVASSTAANVALQTLVGMAASGRHDLILIYPGTYVFANYVTVNKNVTIMGASDTGADVVIDCDTNNVVAFIVSADGVTLKNLRIDEANGGVVDCISSTGNAFLCENITVDGGNVGSTNACIHALGNYSIIRGCKLELIKKGILIGGSYSYVEDCVVAGTDGTAGNFGISATGAASRVGQVIRNNTVFMTGATNPIGINIQTNADLTQVLFNRVTMLLANAANGMTFQADTYLLGNQTALLTPATTPAYIDT